jgi:hypothetical protein
MWSGEVRRFRFYSPEARGGKESAEICGGFGSEKKESDGVRFWKAPEEGEGKGKETLTGGTHKSAAQAENAAAAERRLTRAMTGRLTATGLGPRSEAGSGERRAARGKGRPSTGLREESGPREEKFLFFFFSNFSKQIFKRFSNPNLNLIKPLISKI